MTQVRMARPTFSTEHGGRLEVNQLVDVQDSEHETAAQTVARWKRIGLAADADHAPFDVAPTRTEEAVALRARIAQLEAQLANTQVPLGSAPPFAGAEIGTLVDPAGNPFLRDAAPAAGEDDGDDDGNDEEEAAPAARPRTARRR